MTVNTDSPRHTVPGRHIPADAVPRQVSAPQVVAMPGLGWSQAVELPQTVAVATKPAEARRAWIHTAAAEQVLTLYRAACAGGRAPASPWWLRALAAGALPSRAAAFEIEDEVATFLNGRPGWVYVPWAQDGESGYWEYGPSERPEHGRPNPTTLSHTDRHRGWIDLLPAHDEAIPAPVAVTGVADLRGRIEEFETIR